MTRAWFRTVATCFAVMSLISCPLASLAAGQEEGGRGLDPSKPATEVYRNIKVLKDASAGEVQMAMEFMAAALGVRCDHCHARGFERDEKPPKEAARRMIQMVRLLNEENFDGEPKVNCYTCHHGQPAPRSAPAVEDGAEPDSRPLPTASTVLARFQEAIGGEAAITKVQGVLLKGSEPSPRGTVAFEEVLSRPGKVWRSDGTLDRAMTRGFDGSDAWMAQPGRVRNLLGERAAALRMEADLIENLDLEARFEQLKVTGRERIAGHDAIVVAGTPRTGEEGAAPFEREQLFFDAKSGLLLRRVREAHTVLGPLPMAHDYEDYRAVNGVQFPFKRRTASGREARTQQFEQITLNPQVTDAKFARPKG